MGSPINRIVVKRRVPRRGFCIHLVPVQKFQALCGYRPSGRGTGWTVWISDRLGDMRRCEKCYAKLAQGMSPYVLEESP